MTANEYLSGLAFRIVEYSWTLKGLQFLKAGFCDLGFRETPVTVSLR